MTDQELLLAAEMLKLAADRFSSFGCNDLDSDAIKLIVNKDHLCRSIREWNGEDCPEIVEDINDYTLMKYLADRAIEYVRDNQ